MARSTTTTHGRDHEAVRQFVRTVDDVPVVLIDPHLDVLAASSFARAIQPDLDEGVNLLRVGVRTADQAPLPAADALHADLAALLHGAIERSADPERFGALLEDLVASSRGFSAAWSASEPRVVHRPVSLTHATAGPLLLDAMRLPLERAGTSLVFARSADEATRKRLELLHGH